SESAIFLTDLDARIRFVKDAAGRITHLVAHWGGDELKAVRLEEKRDPKVASQAKGAGASAASDLPGDGPYDIVILGGRVVDGTGNAWFHGDVALQGDRIARVAPAGRLGNVAARERIDANGLVVCPGFIDIQGQSRSAFLSGDGRVI